MTFTIRITVVILELIRAKRPDFLERLHLLELEPTHPLDEVLVSHNNLANRMALPAMFHSSF